MFEDRLSTIRLLSRIHRMPALRRTLSTKTYIGNGPLKIKNSFWNRQIPTSSQRINSVTSQGNKGDDYFSQYYHLPMLTYKEVIEVWQKYQSLGHIDRNDSLKLIQLFYNSNREDLSLEILKNLDFKKMSPEELIKIGTLCGKLNAKGVITSIVQMFSDNPHNRPVLFRFLERLTLQNLADKKALSTLFTLLSCYKLLFKDFRLTNNYYGTPFVELLGKVLRELDIKARSSNIYSEIERFDDSKVRENMHYIIIRAMNKCALRQDKIWIYFEGIPSRSRSTPAVSLVYRIMRYGGSPEKAKYIYENYSDLLFKSDGHRAALFKSIEHTDHYHIYEKYKAALAQGENIQKEDLRSLSKFLARKGSPLFLEIMDQNIEKFPSPLGTYHTLMEVLLKTGNFEGFFKIFSRIQESKIINPDHGTYTLLLRQFAQKDDLESMFSLADLILDRRMGLRMEHINVIMAYCTKTGNFNGAMRTERLIDQVPRLSRNLEYYNLLMGLYVNTSNFEQAIKLFKTCPIPPDATMYSEVLKIYVKTKMFNEAANLYERLKEGDYVLNKAFYNNLVAYFCATDQMDSAEATLADLVAGAEADETPEAFEIIMENYLSRRNYVECIKTFSKCTELDIIPTTPMYQKLVQALASLNFVNRDNYSRPTKIVEEILELHKRKNLTSKRREPLDIRTIKPLIKYLAKYYDAAQALVLLEKFDLVNEGIDMSRNLTYIKTQLLILSQNEHWERFNALFETFIAEIKYRLSHTGIAPIALRDMMVPVIGLKSRSIQKGFGDISDFKDFVETFVLSKKFKLSNENVNDIAVTLLGHPESFDLGAYLVEKKLMGGFIARAVTRQRDWSDENRPLGVPANLYENPIKKPTFHLLDTYYIPVALRIRNNLYHSLRSKSHEDRIQHMNHFKNKYPKLFRNFPSTLSKHLPKLGLKAFIEGNPPLKPKESY